MHPLSLWPVVIVYGLVLGTAALLTRRVAFPPAAGRFATLDGLRGFLAFGVFLHHGAVWYFYVRTGVWTPPASHAYANLGQDSVALFFMITGFLFWTKLRDGRGRGFDWLRLYVSRVLRLTPVYFFALLVGALLLAAAMGFQRHEPVAQLVIEAVRWMSFTVLGPQPVNGWPDSFVVLGGVTWTLPYEWLFYCALPLLALLLGVRAPWSLRAAALVVVVAVTWHLKPEFAYLACFGGGILTAYLVRWPEFCRHAAKPFAALVAVAALAAAWLLFPDLKNFGAPVLLTLAFALITAGNTLGGVLAWPASRLVGEITYSVYLLHGLVLFGVFRFLLGFPRAAALSVPVHWLIICACAPLTVLLCTLTFRWIEAPAMARTTQVAVWLRRYLGRAQARDMRAAARPQ